MQRNTHFARRRACLSIMQGRKTPTIRPIQSTIHIVAPAHVASAMGAIGARWPSETAGPSSTEAGHDDEECLVPRVPSPLGRNPRDRRWWAIAMAQGHVGRGGFGFYCAAAAFPKLRDFLPKIGSTY